MSFKEAAMNVFIPNPHAKLSEYERFLLEEDTKENMLRQRRHAFHVVLTWVAVHLSLVLVVLFVEPFHFLTSTQVPNVLYLQRFANISSLRGVATSSAMIAMPEPLWPNSTVLQELPSREAMARQSFWLTFMAMLVVSATVLGTIIMKLRACGPTQGYDRVRQNADSEVARLLLEGRCSSILCGMAVLSQLLLISKLVLTAAFSGTLSPERGLAYEAYSEMLAYGAACLVCEAIVWRFVRPQATCSTGAFAVAAITAILPFASDPFDSLKDGVFSALALQRGLHSTSRFEQFIGYTVGLSSFAWLWGMHGYMLCRSHLRQELASSYLGVLFVKPQGPEETIDQQDSQRGEEKADEYQRPTQLCESASLEIRKILFKQSTPERQAALAVEDGPQGGLAVLFSVLSFSPFVVIANIAVPICRWCFARILYPYFLQQEAIARWLAEEFIVYSDGGIETKQAWFQGHLLATGQVGYTALFDMLKAMSQETQSQFPGRAEAVQACEALTTDGSLTELVLQSKGLDAVGATLLAGALTVNGCLLQELGLRDNRIGSAGAAALAGALQVNASVLKLDLRGNGLGDEGATSLADALKANSYLQELGLADNSIGSVGATSLAGVLRVNASLRKLDLRGNGLGDEEAASLADALKANSCLQELLLLGNGIGSAGAAALAGALRVNASLRKLILAGNDISDEGATSLADALKVNSCLQELLLAVNGIGSAGAAALSGALRVNACLRKLNLGGNGLGDEEAASLADALKVNSCLQELGLTGNRIGAAGAAVLAGALRVNASLRVLDLARNDLGAEGATSLAEALKVNSCLQELGLEENTITDAGASSLAEALKMNNSLQKLDFSYRNSISAEASNILKELLDGRSAT